MESNTVWCHTRSEMHVTFPQALPIFMAWTSTLEDYMGKGRGLDFFPFFLSLLPTPKCRLLETPSSLSLGAGALGSPALGLDSSTPLPPRCPARSRLCRLPQLSRPPPLGASAARVCLSLALAFPLTPASFPLTLLLLPSLHLSARTASAAGRPVRLLPAFAGEGCELSRPAASGRVKAEVRQHKQCKQWRHSARASSSERFGSLRIWLFAVSLTWKSRGGKWGWQQEGKTLLLRTSAERLLFSTSGCFSHRCTGRSVLTGCVERRMDAGGKDGCSAVRMSCPFLQSSWDWKQQRVGTWLKGIAQITRKRVNFSKEPGAVAVGACYYLP